MESTTFSETQYSAQFEEFFSGLISHSKTFKARFTVDFKEGEQEQRYFIHSLNKLNLKAFSKDIDSICDEGFSGLTDSLSNISDDLKEEYLTDIYLGLEEMLSYVSEGTIKRFNSDGQLQQYPYEYFTNIEAICMSETNLVGDVEYIQERIQEAMLLYVACWTYSIGEIIKNVDYLIRQSVISQLQVEKKDKNAFKIPTSLTLEQLACFFRILQDAEIISIPEKSIGKYYKTMANSFLTVRKRNKMANFQPLSYRNALALFTAADAAFWHVNFSKLVKYAVDLKNNIDR
jgi:hypothetical protein